MGSTCSCCWRTRRERRRSTSWRSGRRGRARARSDSASLGRMFDTKIAIVIREDLAVWQKLNVAAFLTSGIVGASEGLLGEAYQDAAANTYNPLAIQPMIVLGADADTMRTIYHRAMKRGVRFSLYIEDMFKTGHDAANREIVKSWCPEK